MLSIVRIGQDVAMSVAKDMAKIEGLNYYYLYELYNNIYII